MRGEGGGGGAGAHTRQVWDDLMEAWGGKGGSCNNREGAGDRGGGSECGQGLQERIFLFVALVPQMQSRNYRQ